jgi:hypothetical protein
LEEQTLHSSRSAAQTRVDGQRKGFVIGQAVMQRALSPVPAIRQRVLSQVVFSSFSQGTAWQAVPFHQQSGATPHMSSMPIIMHGGKTLAPSPPMFVDVPDEGVSGSVSLSKNETHLPSLF